MLFLVVSESYQVPSRCKATISLTKVKLAAIYVSVFLCLVKKVSLSSHWCSRCSEADCSLCGKDNWNRGGALL